MGRFFAYFLLGLLLYFLFGPHMTSRVTPGQSPLWSIVGLAVGGGLLWLIHYGHARGWTLGVRGLGDSQGMLVRKGEPYYDFCRFFWNAMGIVMILAVIRSLTGR